MFILLSIISGNISPFTVWKARYSFCVNWFLFNAPEFPAYIKSVLDKLYLWLYNSFISSSIYEANSPLGKYNSWDIIFSENSLLIMYDNIFNDASCFFDDSKTE